MMPPTYEWNCSKCDKEFETVESIVEYSGQTTCPTCNNLTKERILSSKVHFIGTKTEDREFNPALGVVTKGKKHREEIAKQKGLIEIGNEKPEKIHEYHEKDRQDRLKKSWDDV